MTTYTKEQVEAAFAEYKKTHPKASIEFKGLDSVWLIWQDSGSIRKTTFNGLMKFISNKPKQDIFKFDKLVKQIKKEWKSVSCSMTKEEYEQLLAIANKNGVKINQLLRTVLLRVIESNK